MGWSRTVRLCGLCLLGWEHRECVDMALKVLWWCERALRQAIKGAGG